MKIIIGCWCSGAAAIFYKRMTTNYIFQNMIIINNKNVIFVKVLSLMKVTAVLFLFSVFIYFILCAYFITSGAERQYFYIKVRKEKNIIAIAHKYSTKNRLLRFYYMWHFVCVKKGKSRTEEVGEAEETAEIRILFLSLVLGEFFLFFVFLFCYFCCINKIESG